MNWDVRPALELCALCRHRAHPRHLVEVGTMGPRASVGTTCFGCAECDALFQRFHD